MRLSDEVNELEDALENLPFYRLEDVNTPTIHILGPVVAGPDIPDLEEALDELADVSNTVDFLFEKITRHIVPARRSES